MKLSTNLHHMIRKSQKGFWVRRQRSRSLGLHLREHCECDITLVIRRIL